MDFASESQKNKSKVELWLREYTENIDAPEVTILNAVRYSLLAGGKRLRPVMFLAVSSLLGLDDETARPYACAIEMIHTYSLIHDDLPAMDDDDTRRGKPSNHIAFGEGMAVLAGDALLNMAFEVVNADAKSTADINLLRRKIDAAAYIGNASGLGGMVTGQSFDLVYRNREISGELLKQMHSKKTGALISASVVAPAILKGTDAKNVAALEKYAFDIGLGFQIKDDILDAEGSAEILGKPAGGDVLKSKSTFVSLFGLEESKKILGEVIREAVSAISVFGEKAVFLIHLAEFIENREK